MQYNKEIYVNNYFEIHEFYSKIYGFERTIIIMQVGSFHECYCTDNEGLNLIELSQKLDIICTKKNNKESVSLKNPRMIGFPTYVTETFIDKLCNLNYTVIRIDQTSEPPKPKREVVGIFSQGTLINKQLNSVNLNYIVSIVIDKIKNNNLCIGVSSYDLSTGYGSYFETCSNSDYIMSSLDDTNRYLETCPPKEIILHHTITNKIHNMTIEDILGYLNINNKIIFSYNNTKNNEKLSYQKILFEKIFPNHKNIFDILNLHLYNWARHSLTNLYEYIQNHQNNLLNKLKLPIEFENNKYLYLGNHPLDQLNVFNKNSKNNEKSLYQIINNTKTILGKRFLNDSLTKPLINIEELNYRYDLIEKILNNNHSNKLNFLLEDISDIERLIRRIELNIMHPYELYLLYLSLYQIDKLIIYCNETKIFDTKNEFIIYSVSNIINYISESFNLDLINSLNFINFDEYNKNIFKIGKYHELDELYNDINSLNSFMDILVEKLSNLIGDKKIFIKKNEDNNMLTIKFNERDGHYLHITNRRCEILKKALSETIEIGKIKLSLSDFEFTELPKSSYTKINCKKIKEISNNLIIQQKKMAKLIKSKFILELEYISNNYMEVLNYWGKKIGFIDFINSGAITSIKCHYSKPIIIKSEISYFKSKNMRHPIVEIISTDFEYKPHSISLGDNETGILLYGINSSGKSTLMKSIGLNIILAQIGYYVACDEFIFTPYYSLFTRIHGNDNIYKGLSSFMVELIELTSILKKNNSNTLVIGDEIAHGSEQRSATVIVAYMLKTLCESNTSFITATHLHELVELPTVKNLNNLKIKHIHLDYDEINDCFIYDRLLCDGPGPNFYGLQFAKYLMKNKYFNEITNNILDEYNNKNIIKQSYYNNENYLLECQICKIQKKLESHHIIFQKDFDKNKINKNKLHLQKDANYNLVTLCQQCHDDVDNNKIIINGWLETSNGRILDYILKKKNTKKIKYTDELILYIKELREITNDAKFAKIKIKEKFDKKISSQSILKYWD